jgi:HAMP domain-containing protein
MTGAQKKEEIDRLKILIGEIAQQMEDARKTLNRP